MYKAFKNYFVLFKISRMNFYLCYVMCFNIQYYNEIHKLLSAYLKLKCINMCTVQQIMNFILDYPKILAVSAISHPVPAAFTYRLGKLGPSMAAAVLQSTLPFLQLTSVILVQATDGGAEK